MKAATKTGTGPGSAHVGEPGLPLSGRTIELYGHRIQIRGESEVYDLDHAVSFDASKDPVLVSRAWKPQDTVVEIAGVKIGDGITKEAMGPCSIENERQAMEAAKALSQLGVKLFRGAGFKDRNGPYGYRGLGGEGLRLLRKAGDRYGMAVISEIVDPRDLHLFLEYEIDAVQVGATMAKSGSLLETLGEAGVTVLLKNSPGRDWMSWMWAGEYVLAQGNGNVILCERGISTHETAGRYTQNIAAIAKAQQFSHLPIAGDPSHTAGDNKLVPAHLAALLSLEVSMVLIEVHPYEKTLRRTDAKQQLSIDEAASMLEKQIRPLQEAQRRKLAEA